MKIAQTNPFRTVASAVDKYHQLISPTYGPAGRKVLIANSEYDVKAVDDGHMASQSFELEDEFQNAVILYIKEAAKQTNARVGDGTTTAGLIMSAIVKEVLKDLDDPFITKRNFHAKAVELQKAVKEAVDTIKQASKDIKTKDELYAIAYNSYNNEAVAKLISDTLFKIGKDGILAIEDAAGMETEVEVVQGLELAKGYASPYFINTDKEQVVLQNPAVIIINKKLELFSEVVPLLQGFMGKPFVLIADGFGDDMIRNTIFQKLKGTFAPLLVEIPGFGDQKLDNLTDLAIACGATLIENHAIKLSDWKPEYAGTCKKVVSKKDKTTFIGSGGDKTLIDARIKDIKTILEGISLEYEKERYKKRIASLQGGIAVLKVGAPTEQEQKSIKAKVDDAVNATKIAFKDGVVPGAGKTYEKIKTQSAELNEALKAPRKQLEDNGKEFLDEKVFDPTGVLIAALESAVSIACGLIEFGGIITNKREEED